MRSLFGAVALFASVVGGVFLLIGGPIHAAGDPAKGKVLYDKYCVVCHGAQGKGDGPAGRMLKPPAADFTSAASKKKSETELAQVVQNGKPGTAMGPWKGQLSQAELTEVLAYVMGLRN
jgi:mono/diheme cytochrome c family protein